MKRRTFLKQGLGRLFAICGIGGGVEFYARHIEPYMLNITRETIISTQIPKAFHNFKIAHFSDTHLGFHYPLENLMRLAHTINRHKPDIIVFTGDLVDKPSEYEWNPQLIHILDYLDAPYGKYWTFGNHDYNSFSTRPLENTMNKGNFTLLRNQHVLINKDTDHIIIAGIDDVLLGEPDLQQALNGTDPSLFTLLLAHEPDFADMALHYPVNMQLSGHSHGGQVRFPIVGEVFTPAMGTKYVEGLFKLNKDRLNLYVNRGIGTTRLPYRFMCQPELTLFTLKSTK